MEGMINEYTLEIIAMNHGHQGMNKTLDQINDEVWFPRMDEKGHQTISDYLEC